MIAALLIFISRLGHWSCIIVSTIAGSVALATIPALVHGSPRYAFVIIGAIGAMFGCWLGLTSAAGLIDEPTEFVSMREFKRIFWMHMAFAIVALLFDCVAGCIIGIGMHEFAGRP